MQTTAPRFDVNASWEVDGNRIVIGTRMEHGKRDDGSFWAKVYWVANVNGVRVMNDGATEHDARWAAFKHIEARQAERLAA